MAVSIKNKIRVGTLFLFLLVVLSGGLSIYYLLRLKADSDNIIKDNYESLDYCHNMQRQMDSLDFKSGNATAKFDVYLRKQENNITEPGEKESTGQLRAMFNTLVNGDTTKAKGAEIRHQIQSILSLNMQAIELKNNRAQKGAESALTILILIAALTFIIGITFIYNFPSVVVTPIHKLIEAVKEISAKNYRHRIRMDNKDEFGQLADAFNDMSARLEEFESSNLNKLIFEKSRAEAVINSLKDASIGIDKNDFVLFANQQALQLLGLKSSEIIAKSVKEVVARNDLFKFLLSADSNPFKIVVEDKENYYIKEVLEVNQGEMNNKVIILKNITSYKELDVAKTNFIATVSHELKTPLASSDFSLKLLEDIRIGDLSDEQKELVLQLKNDNQRMLRILSELLNMSQAEAGKIQLNIQGVSPYSIIQTSLNAIAGTAREKQIQINSQIPEGLPDIKADPDKISWVLNNFLSNAIRYSPEQTVVTIEVKRNQDEILFSVADKGPGIDQQYLKRIFERYFQIPGRIDKTGSGIGLAICKEFIEAMNGKIWVNSEIGTGSTFGFSIGII